MLFMRKKITIYYPAPAQPVTFEKVSDERLGENGELHFKDEVTGEVIRTTLPYQIEERY
jgi:hypothetical protein